MTDSEAMRIGEQIDAHNWRILELIQKLAAHPSFEAMEHSLLINGFPNPACATDIIRDHLTRSESWVKTGTGYKFQPRIPLDESHPS